MRPRPTFLSGRAAGPVYPACPFCPAIRWLASPASQVSPGAYVLAAAFVPAFVAVVRVFVRALAVGVVASAPFAIAFVRAGVVVLHQPAVASPSWARRMACFRSTRLWFPPRMCASCRFTLLQVRFPAVAGRDRL